MAVDSASALALRPSRLGAAPVAPPAPQPEHVAGRTPRAGLVPRPRLSRRLAAVDAPLATIAAPAGYGKTTLLAEWEARDARPFAWVAVTRPDACGLAAAMIAAASPGGADDPPRGDASELSALVAAAAGRHGPVVLVLDDAHRLTDPQALRLLAELPWRLPPGSTLALAARGGPPVDVARLRAHRLLTELGAPQLAMNRLEASMLLDGAGAPVSGGQLDHLLEATEGWPAGLYLAALSLREQPGDAGAAARFGGADRLVAGYIQSELLDALPGAQRVFLRRTSILERLTAPLCDSVLAADDSGAMLARLTGRELPIAPLDREDTTFRCHPLLADVLRAELAELEPELAPELHRRAADWHGRLGDAWAALGHAIAAHDAGRAAALLWSLAPGYAARGRAAAVERRLSAFTPRELAADARLALAAAACHVAQGRRPAAERRTDAAERAAGEDSGVAGAIALLRACVARHGIRRMAADAARACEAPPPGGARPALGRFLMGASAHLAGERDDARARLEEGARDAAGRAPLVEAVCHAQLALLAAELDDSEEAASRAADARAALDGTPPGDSPAHALVLVVCAETAAQAGDAVHGRRDAAGALRALAALERFTPWFVAETQIWLARAELRLCDAATARTLLSRAARLQCQVPDAPVLWAWLHETWERADAFAAGVTGDGPALTNAELRVLRFLPSHLSFREIGGRLHVSTNTVKTQALAVYRKLDVSCRSDAVVAARRIGLIDA